MTTTFDSLGLPAQINQALARMNYTTPTPIQAQAIPLAMAGRDILGSAQTGSGKTAAFSIPLIAKLMSDPKAKALVLAPTRELAAQTLDVVHNLTANNRDIRTALLIGGEAMGKQFDQLRRDPRLVIGTPGRINDHLRRNPKMLQDVVFVAVDEADRMLDMGFSEQIDEILATLPKQRQTLMFSATFPDSIIRFSRSYLNNPERISVGTAKIDAPKIRHEVKHTTDAAKYQDLLAELVAREGSVIIFVKTQHGTERLAKRLEHDSHDNVVIHGGLRQNQREKAVRAFRNQRARIMVATDVAARGLDIPHIEHVINYDLPQVAEDYIHRIGRTARAGAEGNAMCFVLPSDGGKWNAINRILNPGEARPRSERGGRDERPNRNYASKGGRSNGGGFKRDDRASGGRNEFPARRFSGDRPARSFGSDHPNDRQGRVYSNDRPAGSRPFAKQDNRDGARGDGQRADRKPTDRNWNTKDDRGSYTRPKEYKPEWRNEGRSTGEGRGDGRMGNDRGGEHRKSRPANDRDVQTEGRAFSRTSYKKDDRDGGQQRPGRGNFQRDSRSSSSSGEQPNRPAERSAGRPARSREDGFKTRSYNNRDGDAPRKAKAAKPAGPKPFKFKEHSRKPNRFGDKPQAAV